MIRCAKCLICESIADVLQMTLYEKHSIYFCKKESCFCLECKDELDKQNKEISEKTSTTDTTEH